jgi:photosystem II stability/assembly factor-like uncharacterized protein
MNTDLESLYKEAQSALKAKDYERASELLRQILKADVDYKDAAQLLARVIKLSRRRWYNDPRLWSALGALLLVGLGIYLLPKLRGLYNQPALTSVIFPTETLTPTLAPTVTTTTTAKLLPTTTPIPLTWNRISLGQEFQRDTVTAFATDKNDPDVIYAAMKNSGIYKTIDSGLSWRPAHHGLSDAQVVSLLIDSQNPHILYAGTMGGIFKTEDGGENWSRIGEGTYLLIDMQDNSHIYARDENGIYETTDQGNTWKAVYTLEKECPDEIHSWAIHPADGKMLFIGGGETCPGVYQSQNGGGTWTSIGLKDKPNLDALTISLDEQGNYSIYTNFESPIFYEQRSGIYASHNEGVDWSRTRIPNGCDLLISDPDKPATIYCAGSRLRVMQKKGDSWQDIPGTHSIDYSAIHIDHPKDTNRIIIGGNDASTTSDPNVGIFISEDSGISWIQRDNGLGFTRAELKIDPLDNARIYVATYFAYPNTECRLYRSMDGGKSWPLIKWSGGEWCGPAFDSDSMIYMIESQALQGSWDSGKTWLWDAQDKTKEERQLNYDISHKFALPSQQGGSQSVSANPYIDGLIYTIGDVIYHSIDAGYTWQLSEGGEGLWDGRLFYKDQGQTVYAIGRYHQAYSTDIGVTWVSCGEAITTARSDSRLALDPKSSRLFLATPGQGVMTSTDECRSWQPSNQGLNNLFVNTLAIDPNNSDIVYAGTDGGAYASFDSGQTWGQINDGLLGATVVYSIAVEKDSNVYAATPYGIFKLESR